VVAVTEPHIATRVAAERVRITVQLAERGIVKPDLTGHLIRDLERLGLSTAAATDLVALGKQRGREMNEARHRAEAARGA
jgi:hypothetical protein